jgi:hypothetical protein
LIIMNTREIMHELSPVNFCFQRLRKMILWQTAPKRIGKFGSNRQTHAPSPASKGFTTNDDSRKR